MSAPMNDTSEAGAGTVVSMPGRSPAEDNAASEIVFEGVSKSLPVGK